ncbi:UNVERIFIED_CONTAM: hypothetical protein Sangu_1578000 [Sesamum angustifolium]|uniref:Uncharacterized protein n=1 Tax=Sesamum angustifolium TaxID=2727405 RepID=A0AAW2MTD1_9LAMI
MTSLQKLRKPHFLKCVSLLCSGNNSTSPKSNLCVNGSLHILQLFRFCRVERAVNLRNGGDLGELAKKSRVVRREAQAALLDYLHSTRSLQFMDAENMSKNTPEFLDRLLKRVDTNDGDVWPVVDTVLENYCLLCNYGIARNRIGKIYKEATEGDVNREFLEVLEKLKKSGIGYNWLEEHLSEGGSYNWKCMLELIFLLDIGRMVRSHPLLLGTCELKKVTSLLGTLNCGVNRLCQMVKDDPYVLKKWVLGVRVDRLPGPKRVLKVRMLKTKFLLSLGFVEKSKQMEKALKVFRGKGVELQDRFDCLVNSV